MALISLRSVAPASELCSQSGSWLQPPQPISPPIPAYPGQAFDPLYGFLSNQRTEIPEIQLRLGHVEQATVIVQSGFDGLILNAAGAAVKETSYYTEVFWKNLHGIDLEIVGPVSDVDDIFVAFDGSWWVYYHWLLFCLGSAGVADKVLPSTTSIAIPDWTACAPQRPHVISKRVFSAVKRVVDPASLLSLRDGIYRARRAYFLYVEGGQPSDVALHSLYRDVFSGLRSKASPATRSRLFVSRGGRGGPNRVTASDEKIFDPVMIEYDMKKVRLEDLSFQAQIDRFSNANLIVSPHGSGLANLVFAPPEAKVLELQTEFNAPGLLLPWFYRLAAASGLSYAFLNRDAGDFDAERLRGGLEALDVRRPQLSLFVKAWRMAQRRMEATLMPLYRLASQRLKAHWSRMFAAD